MVRRKPIEKMDWSAFALFSGGGNTETFEDTPDGRLKVVRFPLFDTLDCIIEALRANRKAIFLGSTISFWMA